LILLGALALLYASVTANRAPSVIARHKAQSERLNQLDEQVLGTPGITPDEDEK
jgi:hypothetical protein